MAEKYYSLNGLDAIFKQRHKDKIPPSVSRYYHSISLANNTVLYNYIASYASQVPNGHYSSNASIVYPLDAEVYVDALGDLLPSFGVEDGQPEDSPEYQQLIRQINREQAIVLINGVLKELLPLVYVGKRSNMKDTGLLNLKAFLEKLPKKRLIRTPREALALKSDLSLAWGRHVPPSYVDKLLTSLLLVTGVTPKPMPHRNYMFGGRESEILNPVKDCIELAYKSTSSSRLRQQMNDVFKKIGEELVNIVIKYKGASTDRVLSDFCQTVGMGMPIYFKKRYDDARSERIAKILERFADDLCKEYKVTRGNRRPADAVLDIINARSDDFEAILNKVLDVIDKCAKGGSYIVPTA